MCTGGASTGVPAPRTRSGAEVADPIKQAVITVQGIRAQRVPRSRVAPFLLRVALFSGVCATALLGGTAVASAGPPEEGPPTGHGAVKAVSEAPAQIAQPAAQSANPQADNKSPAEPAEPTKPALATPATPAPPALAEPARPEPSQPAHARPARPQQPRTPAEPAASESTESQGTPASADNAIPAQAQSPHATSHAAKNHLDQVAQPSAAHRTAPVPGSVDEPGQSEPSSWQASTEAEPRAPNAEPQRPLKPLRDQPDPTPPAQPAPTCNSAGGTAINGLRYAHYILPTAPGPPARGAGAVVAQRDIDPEIDTRSTEPAASPD